MYGTVIYMNAAIDMPVIILAAGQGRRMRGRDKLLEVIDAEPILRRVARIAGAAGSSLTLIALPTAPHARYATLEGLDIVPVPVPDATEGMNASLRSTFAALPTDAEHAMVVLADMPEVTQDDLQTLAKAVRSHPENRVWRGATQSGLPGHPIVFHRSLFAEFAKLTGDKGGKDVIALAKGRVRLVPLPDTHARLDLDTPEAWDTWLKSRKQ
jgi:CTP:molybdopterin cytidylyltransferase MocA